MSAPTNNVNKTWALLQITGGKNEPNIVLVFRPKPRKQYHNGMISTKDLLEYIHSLPSIALTHLTSLPLTQLFPSQN